MNPSVGIDLGTTNTVIGVQTDATGPRILSILQPVHERNRFEELDHIKSAVLFETEASAVAGAFANDRLDSFRSIKSKMGTRFKARHPYRRDTILTPAYVSAHILRAAYQQIVSTYSEWDRRAVVTVPASFNTDQRNDTVSAARLAGFEDVRLLDEPTAAFYYYFDQYREVLLSTEKQSVLVFDFGGGTLDVSIIQVRAVAGTIHIDPIGRSRYNNLGGDDIDADLAMFLLACWEHESQTRIEQLSAAQRRRVFKLFVDKAREFKEEAENYIAEKMDLNEFRIDEEVIVGQDRLLVRLRRTISRANYDQITGRYLHDGGDLNIFKPIGQALKMAAMIVPGFGVADLDLILYTGGASRMAGVRAELDRYFFPKRAVSLGDAEACNTVALGAACARYDEMHQGSSVVVTSRVLEGVLTRDNNSGGYVVLVPPDSVPSEYYTPVAHTFTTARDAIQLRLPLFRGVSPTDHQLSPIRDLLMPMDSILPAETPYQLFYRVTANKTVDLKARFDTRTGPIEAEGQIEIYGIGSNRSPASRLCAVNAKGAP